MAAKLSADQIASLDLLREKFGAGFGLNEVICYAYHPGAVEGVVIPDASGDIAQDGVVEVSFKPSEDSLYAILKVGTPNAVGDLIAFGLSKLRARL